MVNCTFCKEYMSTLISVISFCEVFNQSFNWLLEFETKYIEVSYLIKKNTETVLLHTCNHLHKLANHT